MKKLSSDNVRDILYLSLLAALPLLGYQFGIGNQVEQFTIVRRLLDPDFLTNDFYVNSAAGFGPRYYYAQFLSLLTAMAPLPAVILALTLISNFALGWVTYSAARNHLNAGALAGAAAALLVVANSSFSLGLASFIRFDSFQPASIAIPLALAGFSGLLANRYFAAAACFLGSAIFHPLIGVETAIIAYFSCAFPLWVKDAKLRSILPLFLKFAPSGVLFSIGILIFWVLPSMAQPGNGIPGKELFEILVKFRAPHHYLASAFPPTHYLSMGLFTVAAGIAAYIQYKNSRTKDTVVTLVSAGAGVLFLCAASAVFVDGFESSAWATAQLFRMLFLLKWIGFLFVAIMLADWIRSGEALKITAGLSPIIATGDAQPIVLAASFAMVHIFDHWHLPKFSRLIAALVLGAAAVLLALKFGAQREIIRAAAGAVCLWLIFKAPGRPLVTRMAAIGLVLGLNIFALINREADYLAQKSFNPTFSWADLSGPEIDAAKWAKANSGDESIWITPPEFENFRLIAERAVVVDFTSIPFDGPAMREWRARMAGLYGNTEQGGFAALRDMRRNYSAIDAEELNRLGEQYGAEWAVLYGQMPVNLPVTFENESFKIVRLEHAREFR